MTSVIIMKDSDRLAHPSGSGLVTVLVLVLASTHHLTTIRKFYHDVKYLIFVVQTLVIPTHNETGLIDLAVYKEIIFLLLHIPIYIS